MRLPSSLSLVCLALVCLSVLPALCSSQATVPYTLCPSGNDHFKITSMTADEWPPTKGNTLNLTINGVTNENVTDGSYSLAVSVDGINIYNENDDLSQLTTLPIAVGNATLIKSVDIPSIAPDGSYKVDITAKDNQGGALTCFSIKFDLSLDTDAPIGRHDIIINNNNNQHKEQEQPAQVPSIPEPRPTSHLPKQRLRVHHQPSHN